MLHVNDFQANKKLVLEDGRPTINGVFCYLWFDICSSRKWDGEVAERYKKVAESIVLPMFCEVVSERAFEELVEEDVYKVWVEIQRKCGEDVDVLYTAGTVICALIEAASSKRLTRMTLWGLPIPQDGHLARYERLSAFSKFVTSASTEEMLAVAKVCSDNYKDHGEMIAAWLVLFTGSPINFACSLKFKDFIDLGEDCWAVSVRSVKGIFREPFVKSTFYRQFAAMSVPPFLAKILLEKKAELKRLYPDADVKDMPLACKGWDYLTPCDFWDVHATIKKAFQMAGIDERVMSYAYRAVAGEKEYRTPGEIFATEYLLRRQLGTEALCPVRFSRFDQHAVLGLRITQRMRECREMNARYATDYYNTDLFRVLSAKLNLRPLQIVLSGWVSPDGQVDPKLIAACEASVCNSDVRNRFGYMTNEKLAQEKRKVIDFELTFAKQSCPELSKYWAELNTKKPFGSPVPAELLTSSVDWETLSN